ncbi:MAG: molybdenum cofactor guanylyltransferase [Oscillospiraceae bacterium]|nr:molybdenum cofactor guanylyltransferase [Oscillospiraceae bacterium]
MSTAVILAGGKSRRMGSDKPRLVYNGKTFLQSAVDRFSQAFDRVLVSVADRDKYADMGFEFVEDIYPGCGPMAGLHAALSACRGDGVFLVAADMPFADPAAALRMIQLCGEYDICALRDKNGRVEPLFAYYKRALIPLAEELLKSGQYKMYALFERARARLLAPPELGALWREGMLDNINFPEDYDRLLSLKRK